MWFCVHFTGLGRRVPRRTIHVDSKDLELVGGNIIGDVIVVLVVDFCAVGAVGGVFTPCMCVCTYVCMYVVDFCAVGAVGGAVCAYVCMYVCM